MIKDLDEKYDNPGPRPGDPGWQASKEDPYFLALVPNPTPIDMGHYVNTPNGVVRIPGRDRMLEEVAGLQDMTDEEWEAACLKAREDPRRDPHVYPAGAGD